MVKESKQRSQQHRRGRFADRADRGELAKSCYLRLHYLYPLLTGMFGAFGDAWRIGVENGDACEGLPKNAIICSVTTTVLNIANLM
jgi:hypothetical protein